MPNWLADDGRYYWRSSVEGSLDVEIPHAPVTNPPNCICPCCAERKATRDQDKPNG